MTYQFLRYYHFQTSTAAITQSSMIAQLGATPLFVQTNVVQYLALAVPNFFFFLRNSHFYLAFIFFSFIKFTDAYSCLQ